LAGFERVNAKVSAGSSNSGLSDRRITLTVFWSSPDAKVKVPLAAV
jgi:hypothetical protein